MKNPKKAKCPTASREKSEAKERIVLVATYKGDQLTKWLGWHNYPIKDGDKISADDAAKITELWLFRGTADQKNYAASFVGIKTRQELIDEYGYPAQGKAHGETYLLFKTAFKYPHAGDVPEDAARVIVRTADFATAPKVRKQLKAYGGFAYDTLVKELGELGCETRSQILNAADYGAKMQEAA